MLQLPKNLQWSICLHLSRHDITRFGLTHTSICLRVLNNQEFWVLKYQHDFKLIPDYNIAKQQYIQDTSYLKVISEDNKSVASRIKLMAISSMHIITYDYNNNIELYQKYGTISNIKTFTTGFCALLYLTTDGSVYEIKDTRMEDLIPWNIVPLFRNYKVRHIYAYDDYICFIAANFSTTCGDLYLVQDEYPIKFIDSDVRLVSGGLEFIAYIKDSNNLVMMGSNKYGQLGRGNLYEYKNPFRKNKLNFPSLRVFLSTVTGIDRFWLINDMDTNYDMVQSKIHINNIVCGDNFTCLHIGTNLYVCGDVRSFWGPYVLTQFHKITDSVKKVYSCQTHIAIKNIRDQLYIFPTPSHPICHLSQYTPNYPIPPPPLKYIASNVDHVCISPHITTWLTSESS